MRFVGMFGLGRVHKAMPRTNKREQNGESKGDAEIEGKGGHNRARLDLRRLVPCRPAAVVGGDVARAKLTSVLNGSRANFKIVSPVESSCLAARAIFIGGKGMQASIQRGITSGRGDDGRKAGRGR